MGQLELEKAGVSEKGSFLNCWSAVQICPWTPAPCPLRYPLFRGIEAFFFFLYFPLQPMLARYGPLAKVEKYRKSTVDSL